MIVSFIHLPSMCPPGWTINGLTYHKSFDHAREFELARYGRTLTEVGQRLFFYKALIPNVPKNRFYSIIFASNMVVGSSSLSVFNPNVAGAMMVPIYVRENVMDPHRMDIAQDVWHNNTSCILNIPAIDDLLKVISNPGCYEPVYSTAYVISALMRYASTSVAAFPYDFLENDYELDLATLARASDEIISESNDSSSDRLASRINVSCILKGRLPDDVLYILRNVRYLGQLTPMIDTRFDRSMYNVLAEGARQEAQNSFANIFNSSPFGMGSAYIRDVPAQCADIDDILFWHANVGISDFRVAYNESAMHSGSVVSFGSPLYGVDEITVPFNEQAAIKVADDFISSLQEHQVYYEHLNDFSVVSTFLENLMIIDHETANSIVTYADLPMLILATGGGILNSWFLHGVEQ